MAVEIKKTEAGSVVIGNAEYPGGQFMLTYGNDDVTIRPLFPNSPVGDINLKLSNIEDGDGEPLANMAALKEYLSEVFYVYSGNSEPEE